MKTSFETCGKQTLAAIGIGLAFALPALAQPASSAGSADAAASAAGTDAAASGVGAPTGNAASGAGVTPAAGTMSGSPGIPAAVPSATMRMKTTVKPAKLCERRNRSTCSSAWR